MVTFFKQYHPGKRKNGHVNNTKNVNKTPFILFCIFIPKIYLNETYINYLSIA